MAATGNARDRWHQLPLLVLACGVTFACWGWLLYLGATQGLDFLKNTKWSISSPPGSRSELADNVAGEYLVQKGQQYSLSQAALVVAKQPGTHPVTAPAVRKLTQKLLEATVGRCDAGVSKDVSENGGLLTCWYRNMHGIFVPDANALAPARACGAARLFEDRDLDVWADLASPDNRSATLILWDINNHFGDAGNKWQVEAWSRLQTAIGAWKTEHQEAGQLQNQDLYEVGFTHYQMLLNAGQTGVIADFEHGDMITLPIAWLILLAFCGPPAVLVLITLPVTLLTVFYLLNQVATGNWFPLADGSARVDFPAFTPAIYINMMIAISLDYGLFVLTRYSEEVAAGKSNVAAVRLALLRSGRVVFVSGVTLGLTNLGLTFCTVDVVASIGWGGTFCCAVAVAVHLTLLPGLLVVFGPALEGCRRQCCSCCGVSSGRSSADDSGGSSVAAGPPHGVSVPSNYRAEDRYMIPYVSHASSLSATLADSLQEAAGPPLRLSRVEAAWVQLGQFCRDHRSAVVASMGVFLLPFLYLTSRYHTSVDGYLLTPRSAPSLAVMQAIPAHGINAAILNPITILVHSDGAAAAPEALSPRCHDDDTDLRQLLGGLDLKIAGHSVRSLPAASVTCAAVRAATHGQFCLNQTFQGTPVRAFAQAYCPGTCTNLCDAAGYGGQSPASRRRAAANTTVLEPRLFALVGQLRARLLAEVPGLRPHAVRDITTEPFTNAAVPNVARAFELLQGPGVRPRTTPYQARFQRLTSYNHSATLLEVLVPHTQAVGGGAAFSLVRRIVREQPFEGSGFGCYVLGGEGVLVDAVDEVFAESPPIIVGVTLCVVFVVAGLAFRSVLIPIRLLGTVAVTLVVVAGSTVGLYQFALGLDGIYWFITVCSASLVIGLTVDYDIFLISRVYEYRHEGYSTEAAILKAMAKASTTITAAGLIMTIAFSSLLLADLTVLNQFGFVLVTASIVDTFLVRALLVPALMFFAVDKNWWPGTMPPPVLTFDGDGGASGGERGLGAGL